MKRKRHTPEQIVGKLREGDPLLNEGKDLTEVLRHLEVSESSAAIPQRGCSWANRRSSMRRSRSGSASVGSWRCVDRC